MLYLVEGNLRLVSQPVGLPSRTYVQIFFPVLPIAGFFLCGALSEERMDLQFTRTIASRPCQSSRSRVPQNSDHILLSHLTLPQPGGPGSRIYIPQEQGGPVISPDTGLPFRCHSQGCGGGILSHLHLSIVPSKQN
jgi:hypothetical protein